MGAFTFSQYRQRLIGDRGGLVIFLVALLCTVVFVRISYADGAKITAMRIHHHATTKKTRLTVEFNQKVAYEQIPGVMLIEFKLLNTALSDFDLPQVQSSDPILKVFTLTPSTRDNTVSLILILHKPAKLDLFWLTDPPDRPRFVIDLRPKIGAAAIAQTPQMEKKQPPEQAPPKPAVQESVTQTPASNAEPVKSGEEEAWAFEGEEEFESFSLAKAKQTPAPPPDTTPTVQPSEGENRGIPVLAPIVPESPQTADTGEGAKIPEGNELKNAMIVQTDAPRPTVSDSGWSPPFSQAKDSWMYFQILLDLLLVGGLVWLSLRLRRNNRLLREIAAHPFDAEARVASQSESDFTVNAEDAADFDEVLQTEVAELPPLDNFRQEPTPQTQEPPLARAEVIPTPNAASEAPSRNSRTQPIPANPTVSTEDMKQALAQISSEIEELMDQGPATSAHEIEVDEETVLEEADQSLEAVVLRMTEEGMGESQIAQQLGLPREEIALMLSLANNRD
ncbi:MAG: hypothetical protein O7E52_18210 [Candidatus Poribacteria bacterium]|nr:hypothetical protein [Candidatus Poribacteria bacterium]